ncbi:replication endonuclease [Vibrio sp. F13]|uniref:replication endonuclease n=1 Tax=Vibrio sp. F13 TaxID=2070777 RepID=UPI001F107447|nr:replication endonuclease [Vibrio sp. F13]
MNTAAMISQRLKRKIRHKDIIPVKSVFDVPMWLAQGMTQSEQLGALFNQKNKDTARQYTYLNGTSFSRHFIPRLPCIVREDIEYQIVKRLKRKSATRDNLERFINGLVKQALKAAALIEDKFPFADERRAKTKPPFQRTNPDAKPLFTSDVYAPVILDHHTLLEDKKLELLAGNLTESFTRRLQDITIEDDTPRGYLNALQSAFAFISEGLRDCCLEPPCVCAKHEDITDAEKDLEVALRRCLDVTYLLRKFKHLRVQYIEYSQIALGRVGKKKGQQPYISSRSLTRWRRKQEEAKQWLASMSAYDSETGLAFDLDEVVKRTTANQENRRIELIVRARGDEERAIDLGYEGIFLTWTLPSKYHRNSTDWNGASVKEGHQNLMEQWKLARAHFQKVDLDWFGLRVAEPHKDATAHMHVFLYVHPSQKGTLVSICNTIACSEDRDELTDTTVRCRVEYADPEKGGATAYILKYISKNINGAYLSEDGAEHTALTVRAWASTHCIKQFSQSGAKPVGLWRQFRRAKALDTAFDQELDAVREACDKSRWKAFCQLAGAEKLAYENQLNQYGENVKCVIGIEWLGRVIQTASTHYSLVRKKDVKRLQEERSSSPWSTENKCNPPPKMEISPLEKALMDVTGWSVKGVQCLLKPLSMGAKIPIDKHTTLSLIHGRLGVT